MLGTEARRYAGSQVDRERWETILGACSEAVAVLDGDGTIVLTSPPFERLLGGDLLEVSFTEVLHPGDVPDFTGTLVSFVAEVGVSTWSQWRLRSFCSPSARTRKISRRAKSRRKTRQNQRTRRVIKTAVSSSGSTPRPRKDSAWFWRKLPPFKLTLRRKAMARCWIQARWRH